MFAYCGNNPVVRIDENGRYWLTTFVTTAIFTGVIAEFAITIVEPFIPDAVCAAGTLYLDAKNYYLSSLMFEHAFIGNGDKFTENDLSEDLKEALKTELLKNEEINRIITNMSNRAKACTVGTVLFLRSFVHFTSGDLHYSLQHVTCTIHAKKEKDHLRVSIRLEDTYNFDKIRTIKEGFSKSNSANDFGYLLQHLDHIEEYKVNICVKFTYQ